jgi:hypothetical protein
MSNRFPYQLGAAFKVGAARSCVHIKANDHLRDTQQPNRFPREHYCCSDFFVCRKVLVTEI